MLEQDGIIARLAKDSAMSAVRQNMMANTGVNPDQEADLQAKARVLGITNEEARASSDTLDAMLTEHYASRLDLPPATRKFLADSDRARLVASTPLAYEQLSIQEQLMNRAARGWAMGAASRAAAEAAAAGQAAQDPALYYDLESAEAQGLGGTDFEFLRDWASRSDSPLMQDAQERLRAASTELADANYEMQQWAVPRVMSDVAQAESFGEALGVALANPIDVILGTGIESAAAMRWSALVTAAGYAVNPVLGAASMGASSFDLEYGSAINDALSEAGIDITDPNAVRKGLQNPELMRSAIEKTRARATTISGFDTLAGLVAPINMKPLTNVVTASRAARRALTDGTSLRQAMIPATVSPVARELDNLFGQMVAGGVLGGAGEAAAQLTTEGRVTSWGDVVLEALGELATAPVDVLMARSNIRRMQEDAVKAEAAKQVGAAITEVLSNAQTSDLAVRSPEAYKQFLEDAAPGTVFEDLRINVEQLKRAGALEAFAQALPALRNEIALAEATGGDIEVTIGDLFVLNQASPETANTVVSITRSGVDGFTLEEAVAFDAETGANISKAASELVAAESKRVADVAARKAELADALRDIEAAIRQAYPDTYEADNLIAANRAMVESLSTRTGLSPRELVNLLGKKLNVESNRGRAVRFNGGEVLGSFTPFFAKIELNKSATASTFMHEMAHYWLEAFSTALSTDSISLTDQSFAESWTEMYKWLGAKGSTTAEMATDLLTSPNKAAMHEKFAEGFEAYMRDGVPPREGLEAVFEAFKEFARRLVAAFPSLNRDAVSEEVMSLYDDIFFSDALAAEGVARAGGVSPEMDAYMRDALSPTEYEAYKRAFTASIGEAATEINASHQRNKTLVNSARERAKRGLDKAYKDILSDAKREVLSRREYQTRDAFMGGASRRPDGLKVKMHRDAARRQLTREMFDYADKRGWLRKDGDNVLAPADIAELLGYPNAQSMVEDAYLANETDVDAAAKAIADERFLKQYGDGATTEKGRQRLAANAAYNRTRLLILATEFKALKKLVGSVRALTRSAEVFAAAALGRLQVSQVRPGGYEATARRNRKDRDRALAKGDTDTAAELTRAELMNAALAKAAGAFIKRRTRFLRSIARTAESKSMDFAYRDQYRALAVRFGLLDPKKARVNPDAPSLSEFLSSSDPFIQKLSAEAPRFLRADFSMNYKDMSVADFLELMLFMNTLASVGRKVGARDRLHAKSSEAVDRVALTDTLVSNAKARGQEKRFDTTDPRPWAKRKEAVVGFFQNHIKMQTWFRIFDGGKFGTWFDRLGKKANACSDKERLWLKRVNEQLQARLDPLIQKGLHSNDVVIGGVKYSLGQRLAIALNLGNEVNRQRLRDGNGFSDADLKAIMESLTVDELRFVQDVWDIFDSFRPEIEAMNRRLYGETLDWTVPAGSVVQSADGVTVTLRGGYYPIRYDTQSAKGQSSRSAQRLDEEMKQALEGGFTGTTTARTYSKARSRDGLSVPLRTDIEPLFDAVNEVIHDVCWREFLLYANRIGSDVKTVDENGNQVVVPGVASTIARWYGPNAARQYRDWLHMIAVGNRTPQTAMDKYATYIRRGVSIAGLGFNVVSALVQITGLIPAMTRVGVKGTASAVLQYMQDPRRAALSVSAQSDFMKVRTDTFLRELDDLKARVQGGGTRAGRALIKTQEAAYVMMAFVQSHVDRIVWMGAYEKFAKEGLSQAECVARADQTVRDTQGSGLIADQSAIENGTVARMFTAFYSFMNTAYNLNAAALLGEKNRYKAVADILVVSAMLPIVEGFLRAALQPGEDDDDKEFVDYVRKSAGDVVSFNMGLLVGVREVSNAVGNFVAGEPVYTWRGPSSFRFFSDVTQLLSQADQGEFDTALVKSIINVTATTFALPGAQAIKAVDGFEALVVDEKTDNPLVLITGYKD